MKKLSLLFVTAFYCITTFGQEIVLTFNSVDASKTIDSIKVTNVQSGNRATVIGESTVDLQSVFTSVNTIHKREREMTVFPNPFNESTSINYSLDEADDVTILLTNSLGQTVASTKAGLNPGTHRFKILTDNTGMYYLTIVSLKSQESKKIISLNKAGRGNKIEYIGFEKSVYIEKSASESGGLLHIELSSGNDKTIIADLPTESKTYEVEFHECKDADGKNYKTVKIGEQWWMAENLAYLPTVSPPSEYPYTEPFYFVYDYKGTSILEAKETENYKTYGALYNWPASKVACPEGWHLPADLEWEQLAEYVSDKMGPFNTDEYGCWENVGNFLKATNGWNTDGVGTDDFGFSGLPGGLYSGYGFDGVGYGYWWSSTEYDSYTDVAWYRRLTYTYAKFESYGHYVNCGLSVRCIKN